MPIYEYHCADCGEEFEFLQKMSDPPLATCPKCQKQVKRLISQTSFSLKGSGWYKDGYSPPKVKGEKAASETTSSGESKQAEKPEKKPEKAASTEKK